MPLPQDNDYRPPMLDFEKRDDNDVRLLVTSTDESSCEFGIFSWDQLTDFARRVLEAVIKPNATGG